jgi:hypothetical protein
MISEVNAGELPNHLVSSASLRGAGKWRGCQDGENDSDAGCNPDLWLYRDRTAALLWRYMRLAVEAGRLPSLLGREFFRARVSPYSAQTFEDAVIFVHDVESCVESLDATDKVLIAMVAMEQYTQKEAAVSLNCTQRTIGRRYVDALDNLSELFLKREILTAIPGQNKNSTEACQEGKASESDASDSE